MHRFSLVLIVGLLVSGVASDGDFGVCEPDKNGCSECYFALVKALLGSDDNVFNLSQVFTPPTSDQPTYVTVNYRFVNCSENDGNVSSNVSCIDENHTWLWAKSGAYLLYPLATFQFISLLFGNAEHLYEREVHVTLDATDCYGVSADHIALLTQRLKVHILEQNLYPKMEESYKAVAVNDNSVEEVFFNSFYSGNALSSEHILFVCPIMVIVALLIITGIVFVLHVWRWGLKKIHHGLKSPAKVNILSFTIISLVRLIIFLIFDGFAVRYELPCTDPRVTSVCKFVHLLYSVPLTLLICDVISMLIALLSLFVSLIFYVSKLKGCKIILRDSHYYCLIIPVACFIFSCLLHAPYITMAYLSDAHYATSVLVYYMTILFIELGLIHHTLKVFFDLRNKKIRNKKIGQLLLAVAVFVIFVLILLVYGLVISLSFFYYYLPINNTITDLPNEGIIVYQTALLLAGAYITYKAVFQRERKLKEIHALDDSICRVKKAEITILNAKIAVSTDEDDIKKKKNEIITFQEEIKLVRVHRSIMHFHNANHRTSSDDSMLKLLQTQEEELLKSLRIKSQPDEFTYYEKRIKERRQDFDEPTVGPADDNEIELQHNVLDARGDEPMMAAAEDAV